MSDWAAINPRLVSIVKLRRSETMMAKERLRPEERRFSLWRRFGRSIREKKAISSHKTVVLD